MQSLSLQPCMKCTNLTVNKNRDQNRIGQNSDQSTEDEDDDEEAQSKIRKYITREHPKTANECP